MKPQLPGAAQVVQECVRSRINKTAKLSITTHGRQHRESLRQPTFTTALNCVLQPAMRASSISSTGPRLHSRPRKTPRPQAHPVEAPPPQGPPQHRILPRQSVDPGSDSQSKSGLRKVPRSLSPVIATFTERTLSGQPIAKATTSRLTPLASAGLLVANRVPNRP